MTNWVPASEAETAMRDALRAGDQELYFRVLARTELLLPVSADALAGRAPMGWGTWTSDGRTHVLAFTSPEALRACLAEHAGSAHRVPYHELAQGWPNLEWWLAVNPGLPIEGYLPAWFVGQLARGDVRLPGRTMGARGRLERAGVVSARARATAAVPARTLSTPPPVTPSSATPSPLTPASQVAAPAAMPTGSRSASPAPAMPATAAGAPVPVVAPVAPPPSAPAGPAAAPGSAADLPPAAVSTAADLPSAAALSTPARAGTPTLSSSALWSRRGPRANAATAPAAPGVGADAPSGAAPLAPAVPPPSRGPASAPSFGSPSAVPPSGPQVAPSAGAPGAAAPSGPPPAALSTLAPGTLPTRVPSTPARAGGPAGSVPATTRQEPASAVRPGDPDRPGGMDWSGGPDRARGPDRPGGVEGPATATLDGLAAAHRPGAGSFTPANDVEKRLLEAVEAGSTDRFLSTLLLARVVLPRSPDGVTDARPGEPGYVWRTETIDDRAYVVVFTSPERLAGFFDTPVESVEVKFVQLINVWPGESWSFAVNPGSPVGAKLPGAQIQALATWAADVGLGESAGDAEESSAAAAVRSTAQGQQPTVMQKAIAASRIDHYLERGYDRVCGFVHRAHEVAHLRTPAQLRAALGLGHPGSPFGADDDTVYVLRWPAYRPSLYRIPYGGQTEAAMRAMEGWVIQRGPFRGNGFAPGDSGEVIAEFKVDSARLPHGAQLWRLAADGTEKLVAVLDADGPTWQRVGGA